MVEAGTGAAELARIEASLHASAGATRESIDLGPLVAYLDRDSGEYLLSLAVPKAGVELVGWDEPISRLLALFAARNRRPRLELVAELHPTLPVALERHGFSLEARAPLMVWRPQGRDEDGPDQDGEGGVSEGLDGDRNGSLLFDEELLPHLAAFLRAQARAYGGEVEEAGNAWLPALERGLVGGDVRAAGLLDAPRAGEEPTVRAGATLLRGGDAWELAGVFASPGHRGRGLAARTCTALLRRWRRERPQAEMIWLSAAEGAERLYRNLGFAVVGTQLNYGGPTGASAAGTISTRVERRS